MTVRSPLGRFGIVTVDAIRAILGHPNGSPTVLAVYVALATHADRDEEQSWRCSVKALAEESGVSERSVTAAKNVLSEIGLLTVVPNYTADGDRGWDSYWLRLSPRDAHDSGGGAPDAPGDEEDAGFSSDQVTDQVTESVAAFSVDHPARRLCTQLADHIEALGAKRPTITHTWLTDMDRAIRIDQRTPEQLEACIRWLATPNRDAQFWSSNILSPKKLRANFDKMALQARASKHPHRKLSNIEQARRIRAERDAGQPDHDGRRILGMTHNGQQP